jgi:hypothetical protein
MSIPLVLLRRSRSLTALPFSLFYSAVSVVLITMMAGRDSESLSRIALIAMLLVPAALAHLNLTFLGQRQGIRGSSRLALLPYACALALLPVGWVALERSTLLWSPVWSLLVVVTIANGAICILGSAFALRESTSPLERARARLVLCGAVLLPLLPTALFARGAASLGDIATSFLWASAIVAPLPIGLAISRYNLFDLEWDVRRWIGKLVYFGTIACGVTLVLVVALSAVEAPMPMRHPPFLFALAFGCAAAVEPLRGRLLGFLESMLTVECRDRELAGAPLGTRTPSHTGRLGD